MATHTHPHAHPTHKTHERAQDKKKEASRKAGTPPLHMCTRALVRESKAATHVSTHTHVKGTRKRSERARARATRPAAASLVCARAAACLPPEKRSGKCTAARAKQKAAAPDRLATKKGRRGKAAPHNRSRLFLSFFSLLPKKSLAHFSPVSFLLPPLLSPKKHACKHASPKRPAQNKEASLCSSSSRERLCNSQGRACF